MNKLYNDGGINYTDCKIVTGELSVIRKELLSLSPDKVIWNIDHLSQLPPWGDRIAEHITSLANYFRTSDGKDIFEVFEKALHYSIETQKPLMIRSL